jgi:carboxyl-terminal processing protease
MPKKNILISIAITIALAPMLMAQELDDQDVKQGLSRVAAMLEAISSNFYTELSKDSLLDSAIRGMLGGLDPHSSYMTPDQTIQMRSEQQGAYSGVGITIGLRNGMMTVISPIEDGPADQQGVLAGDVITHIDGSATSGETYADDVNRLRGPLGSNVAITIERQGSGSFDVGITRDNIALKTVPYYFMVDERIGYLRLTAFAQNSGVEMRVALKDLQNQGMQQLIFDLRSNPGGDLSAAVSVADLFIESGLITYMQGLHLSSRVDFNASKDGSQFEGAMVVLINPGSASGSEVVSGALQDYDRAWLVGEKSWGKGLVQTQYPLAYSASLSLTTAKYYTPSGRLIQRPYVRGSFDSYFNPNFQTAEKLADQAFTINLQRPVYGGNGISPDTALANNLVSPTTQLILTSSHIFNFATEYLNNGANADESFRSDTAFMAKFHDYLLGQEVELDEGDWQADFEFLNDRLTIEVLTRIADAGTAYQAVMDHDKQLQKALECFGDAEELLRRIAEKNN